MKLISKVLLPLAVSLPLTVSAAAADLRVTKAPVAVAAGYSWGGLYLSGFGDYGINFTNMATQAGPVTIDLASAPHGFGVGGGVAFLYQAPASPWVLGVRGDIGWLNMQGSGAVSMLTLSGLSVSNATNYLGDANVVVGYTLDPRLLAYLTGGLAFGGAKPNLQFGTLAAAASDTSVGFDIGGGLAYAITSSTSIFIEGDYYQLGGKALSIAGPNGVPLVTSTANYNIAVQKVGLNFRLFP
jgi:outer membrane immunogenic protein